MSEGKPEVGIERGGSESETVNYKKILGDTNILFIFDSHTSFTDKDVFRDALTELTDLGVTDLALEMLPKGFNAEDNEAVKEYFKKHWEKRSGMGNKYFEVYSHAKALGIRVWGLDIPLEEYRAQNISDTFYKRNKQWADLIDEHLKSNPTAKVVVFHGASHAGYYPARDRTNNILKDKGYKPIVVHYFGGDNVYPITEEEKMIKGLVQERNTKEPFMIRLITHRRAADFMVYTGEPQ